MHTTRTTVYYNYRAQLPPHVEPKPLGEPLPRFMDCRICGDRYRMTRDRCPSCGATRMVLASHSYEPYRAAVDSCNARRTAQLVRAIGCTVCADESEILASDYADSDWFGDAGWLQGRLVAR